MKKLILFILVLFITLIGYSQTYSNYGRYMFPTITINTGITWTETHDIRQSPMVSLGLNLNRVLIEYNTDRFTRYVDGYTIQQYNLGYAIAFKNTGGGKNRHNKDYLTFFVGRYNERDDLGNLLQDKNILGVRINTDIRDRFHLWGKVDTNLNIGIGVGIKIFDSNPMRRTGIRCR